MRALLAAFALLFATGAWGQTAAVWIDVPFVAQPREGCGAASIAMVMRYWAAQQNRKEPPASDVSRIQLDLNAPRQHGITTAAMQAYFAQHGYRTFPLSGRWDDLGEQLRKGRPLIVALRPEGQSEFHYVVIDGLDEERGLVMMNDPAERKLLSEERARFEKDWSATHNWLLLAVPVQ